MRRYAIAIACILSAVAALGYLVFARGPEAEKATARGPAPSGRAPKRLVDGSAARPGPKAPAGGAAAAASKPAATPEDAPDVDPEKAKDGAPGTPGALAKDGAARGPGAAAPSPSWPAPGATGVALLMNRERPSWRREAILPRWQTGDSWVVETYYRNMASPQDRLSQKLRWRFTVERETSYHDRPCHVLRIALLDGESMSHENRDFPASTLYITVDNYRLLGAVVPIRQQGKTAMMTLSFADAAGSEGYAAKAAGSIVPFDLPPVGVEATAVPHGASLPRLEDLKELSASDRARLPSPERIFGFGGEYLEIEYDSPIDGTRIHQKWSPEDMRWPAVSLTNTTRSYRLAHDGGRVSQEGSEVEEETSSPAPEGAAEPSDEERGR